MKKLEDYLKYEQPTKYIVKNEKYNDEYATPVLTAGKTFILGYTNETENIFPIEKLPVIIFDDFTTDCKYVDFPFKVKSSAMKILHPINKANAKFLYYYMKNISFDNKLHKRYWISQYSKLEINELDEVKQNEFVKKMEKLENVINIKKNQLNKYNNLIKSQFVAMFENGNYPKEQLKKNIEEMFIGPFGSALKNECFVDECDGYCVVYEQKHAINKNIEDFRWVTESKYNELKRFNVKPGDIIVSCRGTIGKTYVIPEKSPIGIMHPSIMKIRLKKEKYDPRFFEMVLASYLHKNERQTNGATIKMGIKASVLENESFIIPDMNTQIEFLNIIEKIDNQKTEIEKSLKKLEELQSALMQEYFG